MTYGCTRRHFDQSVPKGREVEKSVQKRFLDFARNDMVVDSRRSLSRTAMRGGNDKERVTRASLSATQARRATSDGSRFFQRD